MALTSDVTPVWWSRTKTSLVALVSSRERFVAADPNAANRPSAFSAGRKLSPLACVPPVLLLTRSVVASVTSRTKASWTPFVSPPVRSAAAETKAAT